MPQGIPFLQPQFFRPRENGVAAMPFVTGYTTLGSLRNNYGLGVGFYFTVGATDITVTHLGRWVVSGNSETHVVTLYDGTDVATDGIGNVTVDTNGATPAEFVYEALASPVTLTSGNTYYLMSLENNGGDEWYTDSGTHPTTTGDATLVGACYDAGGMINPSTADGSAFVFPGFLYTL